MLIAFTQQFARLWKFNLLQVINESIPVQECKGQSTEDPIRLESDSQLLCSDLGVEHQS